jgi:hypothetical protein
VVLLDLKSSILREVLAYPRGRKAVLFHLASFILEAQDVRARVLTSPNDGQTTSIIMSHSICKVLIFEHYNIKMFMSIYKHVQSQFFFLLE